MRVDRHVGQGGQLLVLGEGVGRVEVLVDDAGHAILAVAADGLGAVEPDRLVVLDYELEHLRVLGVGGGEEAAGEEVVKLGLAGLVERGADD